MEKILMTYDYGKENLKRIEDLGYELLLREENELEYSDEYEDVEIMMTYHPFKTFDITRMKKLKYIQLFSNGFDQVDKDFIKKNNIILANNRNSYTITISEWIIGKILELLKKSYTCYRKKDKKLWELDRSLLELNQKKIGFVGTGNIAHETAKRLKVFGTILYGVNIDGSDTEYFEKCYPTNEIKEMVNKCDIVISLIPATPETKDIFNKEVFDSMKNGVFFLSCSRGQVVDEEELIKNLKNGKIQAAVMDVFKTEPLPRDSELWDIENLIISPHNAFLADTHEQKIFDLLYENIKKYKNGEKLLNVVNLDRGF